MSAEKRLLQGQGYGHSERSYTKQDLLEKREKSQANISTEQGIYLRICCSIQAEGAFALLKTDFGYPRRRAAALPSPCHGE